MGRYWRGQCIRLIGPTAGNHESILQKAQLDLNIRLSKKTASKNTYPFGRSSYDRKTHTRTDRLTEHKNVPYMGVFC